MQLVLQAYFRQGRAFKKKGHDYKSDSKILSLKGREIAFILFPPCSSK